MSAKHLLSIEDTISSSREYLLDVFRAAALVVEQERESLDQLNSTKTIKEVATLFDISPQELFYYIEYGEEGLVHLMKIGLPKETDE